MSDGTEVGKIGRRKQIELILHDLRDFRDICDPTLTYAVVENINFFEAAKSLRTYISWLLVKYPKIDRKKIRELADFNLRDGIWGQILLEDLLRIEKWKIPDLLEPLRSEIFSLVRKISSEFEYPITVINLGCGAMELERQILNQLEDSNIKVPLVMVGIDNSLQMRDIARDNLHRFGRYVRVLPDLSPTVLEELKNAPGPYSLALVVGDAMDILAGLRHKSVDVVFFSKFLHHLSDNEKVSLNRVLKDVARFVVEFDDYNGWYLPIISLITNWRSPVLLNGAVFSSLRVPSPNELRKGRGREWKIKIIPLKGYIKTYRQL